MCFLLPAGNFWRSDNNRGQSWAHHCFHCEPGCIGNKGQNSHIGRGAGQPYGHLHRDRKQQKNEKRSHQVFQTDLQGQGDGKEGNLGFAMPMEKLNYNFFPFFAVLSPKRLYVQIEPVLCRWRVDPGFCQRNLPNWSAPWMVIIMREPFHQND